VCPRAAGALFVAEKQLHAHASRRKWGRHMAFQEAKAAFSHLARAWETNGNTGYGASTETALSTILVCPTLVFI